MARLASLLAATAAAVAIATQMLAPELAGTVKRDVASALSHLATSAGLDNGDLRPYVDGRTGLSSSEAPSVSVEDLGRFTGAALVHIAAHAPGLIPALVQGGAAASSLAASHAASLVTGATASFCIYAYLPVAMTVKQARTLHAHMTAEAATRSGGSRAIWNARLDLWLLAIQTAAAAGTLVHLCVYVGQAMGKPSDRDKDREAGFVKTALGWFKTNGLQVPHMVVVPSVVARALLKAFIRMAGKYVGESMRLRKRRSRDRSRNSACVCERRRARVCACSRSARF